MCQRKHLLQIAGPTTAKGRVLSIDVLARVYKAELSERREVARMSVLCRHPAASTDPNAAYSTICEGLL